MKTVFKMNLSEKELMIISQAMETLVDSNMRVPSRIRANDLRLQKKLAKISGKNVRVTWKAKE